MHIRRGDCDNCKLSGSFRGMLFFLTILGEYGGKSPSMVGDHNHSLIWWEIRGVTGSDVTIMTSQSLMTSQSSPNPI